MQACSVFYIVNFVHNFTRILHILSPLCISPHQIMPTPEELQGKIILKLRKLPGGVDEYTPLIPNIDER